MSEKIFIQNGTKVVEAKGDDLAYLLAWQAEIIETNAIMYQEQLAKETARQSALAKLAALGLTEEEIAAL
jgi:hypothetical protein